MRQLRISNPDLSFQIEESWDNWRHGNTGEFRSFSAGPDPVFLGLFLLLFGGAMGTRGPVVSSLTARLFEGQVGAVFGLITIGLGLGGATGAWLSGFLHDATGSYEASFAVAALASLTGIAIFWSIPALARGER